MLSIIIDILYTRIFNIILLILLMLTLFFGQFVQSVRWEGMGLRGCIVILASCEYCFTKVQELMQHPSNNISIVITKLKH